MEIQPYTPFYLRNGALMIMDNDGNFWTCDSSDAALVPPKGPERREFVLNNLEEVSDSTNE